MRYPPDGWVVKEQTVRQVLQGVQQKIMTANVRELMQQNGFQLRGAHGAGADAPEYREGFESASVGSGGSAATYEEITSKSFLCQEENRVRKSGGGG